ncbi:AgmX/PglI C-terminal domain-containing protein [Hyalangium versicolor]|uniref:AgmX/PglI C-terminal domain-containing protein n=1 Tax=Hyalangium versicolor TaxID=2861190 RepID=UPI001CCCA197|nr:AgmX/PglI C-terminal domain-containing protein [Hyalangium versicolor]
MSGRSVLLWVLVPFLALCAWVLWSSRPEKPAESPSPQATPPTQAPRPPPVPPSRTFGEGSTLPSRAPPPPPITIPEAEPRQEASTGTVDKEDVRRAIQTVVPLIRQCFQDVAERYSGPQSVTLRFTIEGQGLTGHFKDGEVVDTSIQDPFALACFLDSLLDVRFPAPREGGSVTITYPFRFEPGSDAGR